MSERLIRTVTFMLDGSCVIDYLAPKEDLKSNGISINHAVYVPDDPDYADGIYRARTAIEELLDDVLEDASRLGPPEPGQERMDPDDGDEEYPMQKLLEPDN